jgi:KUP system potassium uptake protein
MSFRDRSTPVVAASGRIVIHIGRDIQTPDIPAALRLLRPEQTESAIDPDAAHYFLSKIELCTGAVPTLARWRKRLFIATSHITAGAADEFGLPRDRTLIVGSQIDV